MKIIFRRHQPKTHKDLMFRVEAMVENKLRTPLQGYVMLDGKEYEMEIHPEAD